MPMSDSLFSFSYRVILHLCFLIGSSIKQTNSEYTDSASVSEKQNTQRILSESMKLLAFGLVLLSCLQSFATSDYQGKVFTDLDLFAASNIVLINKHT